MRILTDRELRHIIDDAKEEVRRDYVIHEDWRRLWDKLSDLEHEIYKLKQKVDNK